MVTTRQRDRNQSGRSARVALAAAVNRQSAQKALRFPTSWREACMRQVFAAVLDGLLVTWVAGIGPLCWILRDGLGPNSVDSHGARALVRFLMPSWWGPVLAALVVLRLAARRRS